MTSETTSPEPLAAPPLPTLEVRSWGSVGTATVILGIPIVAVFGSLAATREGTGGTLLMIAIGALLLLAAFGAAMRMRLVVSPEGVSIRHFWGKETALGWSEIRAIGIARNKGSEDSPRVHFETDTDTIQAYATAGMGKTKRTLVTRVLTDYAAAHGVPCSLRDERELHPNP